jgi:hypothetical protein
MIITSNRLTLIEGRGIYDKDQITEEPCDGKLSRTVLKGRREVVISPIDPNLWLLKQVELQFGIEPSTIQGWETSNLRKHLGLPKDKQDKSRQVPETHAVDGITIAASHWVKYGITSKNSMGWKGHLAITPSQFAIIKRPPVSRRQLHLMVPAKDGVRRKYGGTVTRHGFRKGDYVEATQGAKTYCGWVSGDTEKQVSVSDASWKRLGQFTAKKVRLIQRSTGLIVLSTRKVSSLLPPLGVSLT